MKKNDAPMVKVVVYPEHIVVLSCTKEEYRFIGLLEMHDVRGTHLHKLASVVENECSG